MKQRLLFLTVIVFTKLCVAQNVGIGTTTPTEALHVVGNKALFQTNFVGIGTSTPTTGFTAFAMKSNVNNFYGMYVDAGATGQPFYGYALNGTAKAFHQFNGNNNTWEYYQSNGATPDFFINGNTKAVFNTDFVGIGTSTPTTGFTGFAMKSSVNNFYGSYIDAGATGTPFYGYALNGVAKAYTTYSGPNNRFEYHHTGDAIPDFYISNTEAAFPNTNFLGIGTTTPTTGFTGLTLKSNVNNFYGSYIDAGATGTPFYGYALNGVAKAYTTYSGPNNRFEYHHTSDAVSDFYLSTTDAAFPSINFLGIGTSTPTTGFTGLTLKSNVNNFYGSYIDAGATGTPFYGYALNGVAKAYTTYSGPNNRFEYHHTSDAVSDFYLSTTDAAFPGINFLGIGTSTPTTAFTGLTLKSNVNNFYGSYIDAGATGTPFYGYALNGVAKAYTTYSGPNNRFEYHHTSDAVSDFYIGSTDAAFPGTNFLGIGTSTPTTGFTGLTLKSNVNSFYGTYVDAGPTGVPFYGYALNGVAKAYTTFNGNTDQFEYHHTSDAVADFSVSNTDVNFPIQTVLNLGTSTPFNSSTALTIKNLAATGFWGMYIEAGPTGNPFYGYAVNGSVKAYSQINGGNNNWELVTGGTTSMTVTPTGSVGIGVNPSQKLDVSGTIHASNLNGGATTLSTDASGNIIRTPSDARLKTRIKNIPDALEKVLQMHGVTYNFIDENRFGSNRQMGFLAQELEQIVPEAVSSGGEYKSVNYQVLTAILAEAIKEQQKQIDEQKKENQELRTMMEKILKKN